MLIDIQVIKDFIEYLETSPRYEWAGGMPVEDQNEIEQFMEYKQYKSMQEYHE